MSSPHFPLFSRFGVELEYMVVDRTTLAVRPIVDRVLQDVAKLPGAEAETEEGGDAAYPNDVYLGDIGLSNELTLHVLEMKTAEPAPTLSGLAAQFADRVRKINEVLAKHNAMLLPTGMHPTMDPIAEMRLWPHDYSAVYKTFNRIFDCRGHGWANLQASHLNLPFASFDNPDDEFGKLHAAIRVILPILPALAASTPIMDGRVTGLLDNRLEVYRNNSKKIPQATGKVIPEPVFTKADYERVIFESIYKAYEPHDPAGELRHEWANSRGAIARFMRNAIEIRVLDVQECPAADLAIVAAITSVLKALIAELFAPLSDLRTWQVDPLYTILFNAIHEADEAVIDDANYLALFGFKGSKATTRALWSHLFSTVIEPDNANTEFLPTLRTITDQGCLSRRITRAIGTDTEREHVHTIYHRLAKNLAENTMFG